MALEKKGGGGRGGKLRFSCLLFPVYDSYQIAIHRSIHPCMNSQIDSYSVSYTARIQLLYIAFSVT